MPLKRHACLAVFLLLPACSTLENRMENLAETVSNFVAAVVPEQHREFARDYFDHLLTGEIESGQAVTEAMATTRRFCFADLRRMQDTDESVGENFGQKFDNYPALNQVCSDDDAVLREARHFINGRTPDKVTIGNYQWRRAADGSVTINISLEYHFGEGIVRTGMDYRREGNRRWIEKASVTLDSMTLQDRIWRKLDDAMFLPIWILLAAQLIFYLAVPVVVLLILRQQRRRRAAMLADSRQSGSDHFEA